MSGVDEGTDPNGTHRGRQSLRMSQLLRAAFADVSVSTPPRDVVLNHFSHRYPLLRLHLREISGWAYACEKHCDYYLHEVCSNFPREIRHDFHPGNDHTLILRPFQLSNNNEKFHCAVCGHDDSIHSLFQSYYGCESCNFNLHVECASIPIALSLVPTSGCWVFYNHEHDYLCHFNCGAVSEYGMENHSMGKLQNRLQTLVKTNHPTSTLAGQPCGDVTHFSHRHSLKEYNSAKPLACNLCNSENSIGYFAHPLKLTCYLDYYNENVNCPGCQGRFQNGRSRAYYCAICKFIMNHYELLFEFPFKHENAEIKCNICSKKVMTKDGMLYYSLKRDEALHVVCALKNESNNDVTKMERLSVQRLNEVKISE
ncbi:hypothetical protein H5410_054256 [Solanum commersonii]|uniref:DC1 domain-containing protein n=1 Tax=Solanum commersonii TaxID=4109 RepID=A0A9J5X821_SOLCO|nr:hypothetical protein H5410_054256 [Solanum commersonii]